MKTSLICIVQTQNYSCTLHGEDRHTWRRSYSAATVLGPVLTCASYLENMYHNNNIILINTSKMQCSFQDVVLSHKCQQKNKQTKITLKIK